MTGSRVADYELVEELGAGSQGRCFVARPPERLQLEADLVVVKVLGTHAGEDGRRRVAGELVVVASVQCPQLVTIHEAGHQDGTIFYAMEYVATGSLAQPASPPSRAQILRAVADAARAADALHEAGVTHHAIKPTNVLLTDDGGRLADVAVARVLSPGQTVTGIGPIDALEYVEPGALVGQRAGRASDIWALAVTLHRALTASSVYGDLPVDQPLGALRHVLETTPTLAAGLTAGEADLLEWCLRADRADRPATAAVVAERLDLLAQAA
jgi:serine/threonine protein kinase